jgi:hypothetical protein
LNPREEAAVQLTALAEAFGVSLSAGAFALYLEALEDLDTDALKAACSRAVREQRFFPRAAELRELAGVRRPPRPAEVAESAWGDVLLCIQRRGGWGLLGIDTLRALRAIGGSSMVRVSDDKGGLGALKTRFIDAFLSGESAPTKKLEPGELTKAFKQWGEN